MKNKCFSESRKKCIWVCFIFFIILIIFILKLEFNSHEESILDVQILNFQTYGSTTVTNMSLVYLGKENNSEINKNIENNGGKFSILMSSYEAPYIYCDLYLVIQNIGFFELNFESASTGMNFKMGQYKLSNNKEIQFECNGVFWNVKTRSIRNMFSIIITLSDQSFNMCSYFHPFEEKNLNFIIQYM